MASIQFSRGLNEEVIPDVRLTRAKDGGSGTATFIFDKPQAFNQDTSEEVTGMYLVDEEGEIVTREVKGKFVNGQAQGIEAILIMQNQEEWDRFMRFMERYAEEHGLGFTKA